MLYNRSPVPLALALALAVLAAPSARAELLKSKLGCFFEPPAGFRLASSDGASRYSFTDPDGGMEFDLIGYEAGRFPDAAAMAEETMVKLGSKGDSSAYMYEGRKAIFAELGFGLNQQKKKGFAIFIEGRKADERGYALLAFSDEYDFAAYADFILTCLDSFSVDAPALRAPGPVSQFTLAWPPERTKQRRVSIAPLGGPDAERKAVDLPWSDREAEQESETVDREYKVLRAYADEPKLYQEAWARFYRMIYRESSARLDRLALEAARVLPRDDPTESARRVLAWTQGFEYQRDLEGSDFVAPLASAYGAAGDCDSRAVVAAIVLERLGIDAILMVSAEYKHALLGVDVPGGGQRFGFGGKDYLVGETTAKVGLGMVAKDQADWSKWMGINLGD
jgi:hypothetical protein